MKATSPDNNRQLWRWGGYRILCPAHFEIVPAREVEAPRGPVSNVVVAEEMVLISPPEPRYAAIGGQGGKRIHGRGVSSMAVGEGETGAVSDETAPADADRSLATEESADADGEVASPVLDVVGRGSTIGRYLVVERIGAGAMGIVYAAYDPELDRRIALKLLRTQPTAGDQARRQARLVREAKAIAKVSHPNVVGIFDVGVHDGQVFMAMEHLAGGTLRDWMAPEKKRSWREIVKMFIEVGRGLAGAHAEGLIHRDFKPDNVLLDKSGTPKVVDFGLVRLSAAELTDSGGIEQATRGGSPTIGRVPAVLAGAGLTRTGALAGTPAYMAPEQFAGQEVDERTDQFAFCVALYEALYGERPFAGNNVIALADGVMSGRVREAPKNTEVPAWLRRAVVRGLASNPEARWPSMEPLVAVLADDPAKRRRQWTVAAATVVTVVVAVGVTHRVGSAQRPMCTGGKTRLAGIWEPGPGNSERKAAIHRAFVASGKSYAERAFTGAARILDQYVGRWTAMYTEACEATNVRGEQSPEVLDLRMTCLSDRLGNARALSDVFAAADGKVVENAVSAAATLPSLDRCADIRALRSVVAPPEDAPTLKRVKELRADLARLIALRDSGQCVQASTHADMLITSARALGYQPLLADTLFAAAQMFNNCGAAAETLPRLKEAHVMASASRNDEVAAQSSALIPSIVINRLGQVAVARDWLLVAQGDVARLGRVTLADAMLAQAEGMVAVTEQAYDKALAAADRSIAITRRLLGADDLLTITWEGNKGNLLEAAGRLEEALQVSVKTRQRLEHLLGREHPFIAVQLNNEGEVLNLLGRYDAAESAYAHAVQLFRQGGVGADVLAWALTGLGRALLGKNQPEPAVHPLQEALSIRSEKHVPLPQLGEVRFALARALWSRSADKRRALALAASARRDYGNDKKAIAEIDVWLAHARGQGI